MLFALKSIENNILHIGIFDGPTDKVYTYFQNNTKGSKVQAMKDLEKYFYKSKESLQKNILISLITAKSHFPLPRFKVRQTDGGMQCNL